MTLPSLARRTDLDFVIDPMHESLARLLREFPSSRFHVSEHAADEAIRTRGMFNAVHGTRCGSANECYGYRRLTSAIDPAMSFSSTDVSRSASRLK